MRPSGWWNPVTEGDEDLKDTSHCHVYAYNVFTLKDLHRGQATDGPFRIYRSRRAGCHRMWAYLGRTCAGLVIMCRRIA